MELFDDREFWWRFKWHWIFVIVVLAGLVVGLVSQLLGLIAAAEGAAKILLFFTKALFAVSGFVLAFGVLILLCELTQMLQNNNDKLESVSESLKLVQDVLKHIDRDVCLSETAKQIAFRDADRSGLRESVLNSLHNDDIETTYAMIEDIARRPEYAKLATELRAEADSYKNANDDERTAQIISHVEKLMDKYQWVKASEQIEKLVQAFPDSERAKKMYDVLKERKDLRKKELLSSWDESVKRQDTNKSLRILKELDLYLTPSEGLALQESAKDAFKTKLHNLGVQFSLAVTEKQWSRAVDIGQNIVKNFPNSRMADEIRSKMSVMENLAQK
jgi:hypothetical protein